MCPPSSARARVACALIVTVVLAACVSSPSSSAARETLELSPEIQALIPADVVGVLYMASIDWFEETWGQWSDPQGDSFVKSDWPVGFLLSPLGDDVEWLDRSRPLLIATGAPDLMAGGPPLTFIAPVRPGAADPLAMYEADGALQVRSRGGYLAVSMLEEYLPATELPALLRALPAGQFSLRIDLQRALAPVRPMVEMGMEANLQSPPDEEDDGEGPSLEDKRAIKDSASKSLDALKTIELGVYSREGDVDGAFGIEVLPGSALALSAQPSPANAIALAAALMHDATVRQISAMSWEDLIENFPALQTMFLEASVEDLREELRAPQRAWMEQMQTLGHEITRCAATALKFGPEGLQWQLLTRVDDASDFAARLEALLVVPRPEQLGWGFEGPREETIDGVRVRVFQPRVEWDQLAWAYADSSLAEDADSAKERKTREAFVSALLGPLRVGVHDGVLILCGGQSEALFEQAVSGLRRADATPPAELSRALDWAGGNPNQLLEIELRGLFVSLTEWMVAEGILEGEPLSAGPPSRDWTAMHLSETSLRLSSAFNLLEFYEIGKEMTALESRHHQNDDQDEEHDAHGDGDDR